MGSILDTLTFSESSRRITSSDPVIQLRRRMALALDIQVNAAIAQAKGEAYTIDVEKWVETDKEGGNRECRTVQRIVRKMWFSDTSNNIILELRFGHKVVQVNGKPSIKVGEFANLVPVLEKVRAAVLDGELDVALKAVSDSRKRAKNTTASVQSSLPTINKPEITTPTAPTTMGKPASRPAA